MITTLISLLGGAVEVVGEGGVEGRLEVRGREVHEEGDRGRECWGDGDIYVPGRVYLW